MELKEELFQLLKDNGAVLCGVADLKGIVSDEMPIGISVAIPLPVSLVKDLKNAPTKEYPGIYDSWNSRLDKIVEAGSNFLKSKGYNAYARTLSVVVKSDDYKTDLPHKTVAVHAGLGWIGKSCLLVTPEFGSAVRISSLLTDAPLTPDTPYTESRCGACRNCVDSCPGNALSGKLWTPGMPREEILDYMKCRKAQYEIMKKSTGIEKELCGKCFAVCSYTQKYLNR